MSMIEELKQRRLELGLSQGQVAAMMGTTQSALSRAERGGNPTQDFLQRYDDALRSHAKETGSASVVEIVTIRLIVGSIARQYGLSEVYVYGSVARGEANDDSDVDLLYRTEPGGPSQYDAPGGVAGRAGTCIRPGGFAHFVGFAAT